MIVGTCAGSMLNLDGTIYYRKVIHTNCTGYSRLSSDVHTVKINIDGIGDCVVECDLRTSPYVMMIVPSAADDTGVFR